MSAAGGSAFASMRLAVVPDARRDVEGCRRDGTGSGGVVTAAVGLMGAGAGPSGAGAGGGARGLDTVAGADAGDAGDFSAMRSGRRNQINSAALTNTTAAPIHIH